MVDRWGFVVLVQKGFEMQFRQLIVRVSVTASLGLSWRYRKMLVVLTCYSVSVRVMTITPEKRQ